MIAFPLITGDGQLVSMGDVHFSDALGAPQAYGLIRFSHTSDALRGLAIYLALVPPLLAILMLNSLAMEWAGLAEFQPVVEGMAQLESNSARLAMFGWAVLLAPVAEEVVFRGVAFPVLGAISLTHEVILERTKPINKWSASAKKGDGAT